MDDFNKATFATKFYIQSLKGQQRTVWQNKVIPLVLFTLLFATYKLLFVEQEDNMTKQGDEGEYCSGWRTHPWDV